MNISDLLCGRKDIIKTRRITSVGIESVHMIARNAEERLGFIHELCYCVPWRCQTRTFSRRFTKIFSICKFMTRGLLVYNYIYYLF